MTAFCTDGELDEEDEKLLLQELKLDEQLQLQLLLLQELDEQLLLL